MTMWNTKTLQDLVAVNPTIGTVALLLADTEYAGTFPVATKKFLIHTRDESLFRLSFTTGQVAGPVEPYFSVLAGSRYSEDLLLGTAQRIFYVASPVAGKCIEYIYWTG